MQKLSACSLHVAFAVQDALCERLGFIGTAFSNCHCCVPLGAGWLHRPCSPQLRGIKAAFQTAAKDKGVDSIPDAECIAVLRKLSKQRTESIDAYIAVCHSYRLRPNRIPAC
jgi:hypothetical protein